MKRKGCRIAVVEEDDALRELVRRWLEGAGHVVEAHAVAEPLGDIELVIAEIANPRDAAALLARLAQPALDAPVLLLSARFRSGQGDSAHLADELGVSAVLPKPFTQRQLLAAVAKALRR